MPYHRYKVYDPRFYYGRMTNKLGRRGTVLFLIGVVWISQGISLFFQPEPSTYALLNDGEKIRGLAWFVTGFIAIYYARKPQGYDIIGFISLYFMASFRVFAYGYNFVLWVVPGGVDGNPRGIVGVFSWITIITLLLAVSGWQETKGREVVEE